MEILFEPHPEQTGKADGKIGVAGEIEVEVPGKRDQREG